MSGRNMLGCAAVAILLAACSPGASAAQDTSPATTSATAATRDWGTWHADKRRVDRAVDAALDGPRGADYPTAITILRGSGRPAGVIDLEVGQLVTAAYRDTAVARMPAETLSDGIGYLERAALGRDEGAEVAPQRLRLLFERGLAAGDRRTLAPDAALAACWSAVERKAGGDAARCVAMRKARAEG